MKLVRDKIPEIMKAKQQEVHMHIATEEEYKKFLNAKLREEVAEYLADGNPEELADIIEVIYTLARQKSITPEQLEQKRKEKRAERGGFDQHIILEKW